MAHTRLHTSYGCKFLENVRKIFIKHRTMNEWGNLRSPRQETLEKWFIDFSAAHPGSVNCTCGGFSCCKTASVWASESEVDRIISLFPGSAVFNISKLSSTGWGAQCLHSGYWESYLTQLRHFYSLSTVHTIKTHSRKWKSFATVYAAAQFYCTHSWLLLRTNNILSFLFVYFDLDFSSMM